MTQNHNSVTNANAVNANAVNANASPDTVLCLSWVVFASGQGLRGEYGTTACDDLDATLEQEISALCREFHSSIGVQEVPDGPPVVLFWNAKHAQQSILTQVLRVPPQSGGRVAYEYFSLVLTKADLHALGGNPLRVLQLIDPQELRALCAADLRAPIFITVTMNLAVADDLAPAPAVAAAAAQFARNGTWPATAVNREALLTYGNSGAMSSGGGALRTFATWWPGAKPPRSGVFDIVLHSDDMRVAKPHEIVAIATELNQSLSRNLLAPPSYDAAGGRSYRAILHGADEAQAMLNEAYLPAALEESPHRWVMRPQKVAGLCQKIADDLPVYAARLPAPLSTEMTAFGADLGTRYEQLARELQKLRHPNLLQASRGPSAPGTPVGTSKHYLAGASGTSRPGMQLALVLGSLLALCLLGFGVRALVGQTDIGQTDTKLQPAPGPIKKHAPIAVLSGREVVRRDQQALKLMQTRAEREVFRVAQTLAAQRTAGGKVLSKAALHSIAVDAVAQAMSQTPHPQIKDAQKQLLWRLATPQIRTQALDGIRVGARQSVVDAGEARR